MHFYLRLNFSYKYFLAILLNPNFARGVII